MQRLEDRTIIVTGGASGLGRALSTAFAAEGARVVIGDVRREPLHVGGVPTDELIAGTGGIARFVESDVRSAADIDRLVEAALELGGGRLDVMVNNAMVAGPHSKGLLETTEDDWDIIFDVGLRGSFLGCRSAVRQMLTQEPRNEVRGRVINLGSQQGIVTAPRDTPYGVSKAGAIYLTKQIAVDYAQDLIVCNCISPGKIVTGHPGLPMDPALLENARRRTPWPRLGRPQDIANAAVFLASDRATYITGSNLVVDGGWLAR